MLGIGIISYNDRQYLIHCLESLNKNLVNIDDYKIVMLDNYNDDEIKKIAIKNNCIYLKHTDGNIGFGNGHNYIIKWFFDNKYNLNKYLILNTDMIFEKNFVNELLKTFDVNINATAVIGTIYQIDQQYKTDYEIDTNGIFIQKNLNCYNDKKKYNKITEVYGFSGTAVMFDITKLKDFLPNLFDPLFFMYKEDIDLSFRLRAQNHKIFLNPKAIGYHIRTLNTSYQYEKNIFYKLQSIIKDRSKISKSAEKWSFKNHTIYLLKHISIKLGFKSICFIIIFEIKRFLYALIFRQYLLKEYINVYKVLPLIFKYRKNNIYKYNYKEVKKWMK